jgi:Trk K+ transport system NAD-binding subunit
MFDPALARKLANAFDVETFSTTAISAPVFAAAATDRNILHSFHLGELLLSIAQLQIGDKSKLSGISIREIEAKYDASIVVLFRKAKPDFHPAGDIVIGNGDRIAVLASMETLNDIEKDNGVTA